MTRYDKLQELTKKYGDKTIELIRESERLCDFVLSELPIYLGCDAAKVSGVPPYGDFDPNVQYRNACRSTYHESISYLEPVAIGLCVKIDNLEDRGSTWVRTVLSVWLQDQLLVVHVGEHEERVVLSSDLASGQSELLEAVHKDIEHAFSLELDDATRPQRIGFLTD